MVQNIMPNQLQRGMYFDARTELCIHWTLNAIQCIERNIFSFLDSKCIDTDELRAVGFDGINVNTGAVRGVIHLMEVSLGRPMQWLICLLHANELPLRHLIQKLDGAGKGPEMFSGVIGKSLKTCEQLPVVQFTAVELENCPDIDGADLSTDQQYLYNMCHAISVGQLQ